MTLPNWTREPLVHFLAAGAALFLLFAWIGEEADPASRTITVTKEDRARLALQWEQTMSRAPTDAELDALTEQFVREEVLYREALRLGLDRDDAVVRKRMATKMDYLANSAAETAQPSDEVLQDWLDTHAARFAEDARFSFEQRYFAERSQAEAALASGVSKGEAISLPASLVMQERGRVAGHFGEAFTRSLEAMEPGEDWQGPVASGFGWHLVKLTGRQVGEVPPLDQIRDRVLADWQADTAKARREEGYRILREAYEVEIER
ncbi:peptidyl-prolyl cis-trans isomerase [Erythrobacter sp. HKB08]|uniref:peptidyl-prolyl cis-trans isomerase n=1 Tax=Erythrobacter sp. HKB08 TaxID=2502843 RepID=UPI001008961F|nr:peptidyl-prolyl cis-trans isomerase [Erythrobacter sp. HKB08]